MEFPKLEGKAILAPMSGVTDVAFRSLCRRHGAALTYTEFVSSAALTRSSKKTEKMLATAKEEKPAAVQLFGSSLDEIKKAAQLVEDRFDIIDINCGCPAWRVVRSGAGSELLKDPQKIATFVNKIAAAVDRPVTVKIRSGINREKINALAVAKCIEDAGAAAVAVHGRTQEQGFSGKADWDIIRDVKDAVNIPVIGNGDVSTPEQFLQRLEYSGADYIMIGRGAQCNPYIFSQIRDYMKTGSCERKSWAEQLEEYIELAEKHEMQLLNVKNHAMDLAKGTAGAAQTRKRIAQCRSMNELLSIVA